MANASEVLAQFANLPIAPSMSNWKANANPSIQDGYNQAAADATGVDYVPAVTDTNPLSDSIARSAGQNAYAQDSNGYRSDGQAVGDMLLGALSGFGGTVGGLGALGVGLVNDNAGAWATQKVTDYNSLIQSKQSAGLATHRQANQANDFVAETSNERQYQKDKASQGEFVASLRKIGRNFMSSVGNAWNDPTVLSDGVANAAGSLLVGGPARKAVGFVGSKLLGSMLKRGVIAEATALKAAGLGEKLAMPATIGAMESGGAYQQTVQQVLDMSHEQLMLDSPDYVQLIQQGWNPQDAKNEVATSAGLTAAAIQFPAAAAAGTLVSKFEANPFKGIFKQPGGVLKDALSEGVEEAAQSGGGQLAGNIGIKAFANQNQDLTDQVGQQAGLGALYGMGSAVGIHAPGLAGSAAVETGKAAVWAGKKAIQPAINNLNAIKAAREASSPNSAQNVDAATVQALTEAPAIKEQVQQAVTDGTLTQEQGTSIQDHLDKLHNSMQFDPAVLDAMPISEDLKQLLAPATNAFQALHMASQIAGDKSYSGKDRIDAGIFLNDFLNQTEDQLTSNLNQAVTAVPDEHPFLPQMRQFEDVLLRFQENPDIQKARQKAAEMMARVQASDITDEAVSTPKGQQAVRQVVSLAQSDPAQVSGDLANAVLKHAREGKYTLSQSQTRALNAAAAISRAGNTYTLEAKKLKRSVPDFISQVSKAITTDTGEGNPQGLSAAGHAKAILSAYRNGDVQGAASAMRRFMAFSQHMQNKIDGYNQAYLNGHNSSNNTFKFQALMPSGKMAPSLTGVYLSPKNVGSIKFAQNVQLDAQTVGNIANELALQMPELGVDTIELASLHSDLVGDATKIAKDFIDSKRQVPATGSKETPTPTPEIKPEEPAKVEPAQAQPSTVKTESTATKADTPTPEKINTAPAEQPKVQPEAKTNPVAEPAPQPEPVAETAPETIDQAYPDLIGTKGDKFTPWFHKAFQFPKTAISRLMVAVSPAKAIMDALASNDALKAFIGKDIKNTLTADLVKAYKSYIANGNLVMDEMNQRLEAFLDSAYNKKSKATYRDLLADGNPSGNQINTHVRGKALNIVDQSKNGSFNYNSRLLEGAVISGLQWLITVETKLPNFDAEKLAKMLGISEAEAEQHVNWFNEGIWQTDAKRSLADAILRYWGVQANDNAPLGYTKGIAEGVAAEVLHGLEAAGLIKFDTDFIAGKTRNRILFTDKAKGIYETLAQFPDAIEQATLVEPDETYFIGEAPGKLPSRQLHNSPVPLTEQQKSAAETAQNTPYNVNPYTLAFLELLGNEGVEALFGKGNPTGRGINVNTAKSIKGYNRTVMSAFDSLKALIANMRNQAEATNKDINDLPVFFRYGFSSVGRLQMQGRTNPQSSKLVREVLLPTWSTLDLTDTSSPHYQAFMLAVAQHIGLKVHKGALNAERNNLAVGEAVDTLHGKLADITQMLGDWVAAHDQGDPLSLEQSDVDTIKSKLGNKVSPGAIHAIMEYARYLNSTAEQRASFKTGLYLEADGVTDGPINALVNLVAGKFTPKWLDLVARGGLYLGSTARSLNDYVNGNKAQSEDLYQIATNFLTEKLSLLRSKIAGNAPVTLANEHVHLFLSDTLKDMRFDGQNLVFDRGIAKNPLTVTVYGSGIRGIANKIVAQALEGFYDNLSNGITLDPGMRKAILFLGTKEIQNNFGKLSIKDKSSETNTITGSGDDLTLTKDMVKNIENNVMHLFAKPLHQAISEIMGDALYTAALVRKSTQIQSIFFKYAYRQAIADALANKETGKASDFLSEAELKKIFNDLTTKYPMIDTGHQLIWVGGTERADIETSEFGRDLQEGMSSDGYVYGPENAGVSGIPYLVIATGDGQMVLNALTGESVPEGMLPVFDGINMKLDSIKEDSARINQAVHQGWMENPVQAVSEAFSKFMKAVGLSQEITDDMRDELWRAVEYFEKNALTPPHAPVESIKAVQAELAKTARELTARKAVMAKLNMSVDHMASASSPFVKSDGVELPADPEEAVKVLNEMYAEELAKFPDHTPVVQAEPTEDLKSFIQIVGTFWNGITRLGRDNLKAAVDGLNIPAEHRSLIQAALRSMHLKGWTIAHGTSQKVAEFAERMGIALPTGTEESEGLTLPGSKLVLLQSANSETLTHELLHAATIEQIHAYYTDPTSVRSEVGDAIKRIEVLMREFMGIDPASLTTEQTVAFMDASASIQSVLDDSSLSEAVRKAASLNEFMVWALSNQGLAEVARKTKVQSKHGLMVAKVMAALKKLWRAGLAPHAGDDIFSNLKFNTMVIMQAKPMQLGSSKELSSLAQFQQRGYGQSDRLNQLESSFLDRMAAAMPSQESMDDPAIHAEQLRIDQEHLEMKATASKVRKSFQGNGFNMTQQEASLFETLLVSLGVDETLNPNAQARVQDIFRHVLKNLSYEDFLSNPNTQDPAELDRAKSQYDLIVGNYYVGKDKAGRSTLMPAFLALAMVNDQFRSILEKMTLPSNVSPKDGTLDGLLTNLGEGAMDRLSKAFSGEGILNSNVLSALNLITDRLAQSDAERESFIEQFAAPVGNGVDKLNNWLVRIKDDWTQKGADKLNVINETTNNKAVKLMARAGEAAMGIFNADIGGGLAMGWMSMLNKADIWKPVGDLWAEVIGRTSENAPIFDMVKMVRAFIQQLRQRYREYLPEHVAKQFSRKLTQEEWTALYHGMAKTDLAALHSLGSTKVLGLIKNTVELKSEISNVESRIKQLDSKNANLLLTKSMELADYMMTGKVSGNLLRNADAIAQLLNELPDAARQKRGKPQAALVVAIDQLTSLYALQQLPEDHMTRMAELADKEAKGMEFSFTYMNGLRGEELKKSGSERAILNRFKGHVQTETRSGASLLVRPNSEHADLLARGYVRVGDYQGSMAETGTDFVQGMGYYFAPLSGKSPFNQGIAQNIRHTFFGVDPVTGFSTEGYGAGRVVKQDAVKTIQQRRNANRNSYEPMMPIFDQNGVVVAYERSMDPKQLAKLEHETDLSKVMGIWRGRQVEEAAANRFNAELVKRLHQIWTNADINRRDEYVNLLDPKSHNDPVITDAVSLLSPDMRRMIEDTFGGEGFMVRKDMINDTVGYRSASIGDLWTGVTRIDPKTAEVAADVLTAVMGKNAYKYLVTAEKLWQNFVSDARTTIVVRSIIVPAANLISNVYQLAARGVPLAHITKGMPRKLVEIQTYHNNRIREIKLEADILAVKNNPSKVRALRTELKTIQDGHRRLTIWPLIQAGEFSSVSEATVTREESTLFEGNIYKYLEGKVDQLPEAIRTAGRYAILTRDTSLFQGLQRAVEYGDFLAKAILYDDLTKRKGMDNKEALARISEEYVNYDRMPGRVRGSLENMGLLWFYHFKLRSLKVAMSMIRNNPLHTLLVSLLPTPDFLGSIGLPTKDNIISKAIEGKLGYSIGPLMGMHAQTLNPWLNLMD